MATQNMKRFGIPTALVVGGVAAGSLFAPIGLAAAQEADTDTEPDTTVESDADQAESGETEAGEDSEREGRRGNRRAAKAEALTEALGLTIDEIKAGFTEGNSIADMAEAQGVSTDDVKAALVAAANERIDVAVEAGHLDEAEADKKRAELDERIDEMITADPSEFQGRRGHGNRGDRSGHRGGGFASEVVTETLGLTGEEIRAGIQEGKTLSDLAEEQGVSVDDLAAAMVDAASERIDDAVEEGKIDADAADEKKAELEERIDGVLNGEMSERGGRQGHRGHRGNRGGDAAETAVEDVEDTSLSA